MTRRRLAAVRRLTCVVALCGLVAASAGCGSAHRAATTTTTLQTDDGLRGLVPQPLPFKPRFTLDDTSGRPYNFTAETRGKLTYLYFGYTHCPDACPATMSDLTYALRLQPRSRRRRIAVVFVTVDPTRDTGRVLRTWLDHYNTSFVGLRGTIAQIGVVEHDAGVPTAIKISTKKGASYQVEHSSLLFVYSPDDRAHVVYALGFKPADYAHDIPILLRFNR